MIGRRADPLPAFRFRVEIDAAGFGAASARIEAACSECTGLHAETEVLEYREGGRGFGTLRFRGQTRFPPLVLKRGLSGSSAFWEWYTAVIAGAVVRRNGTICLLDAAGYEQVRWDVFNAFPTRWSGPDLKADSGALAFESVELVHDGFTMRASA